MKWIDKLEEIGTCEKDIRWAKESGYRTIAEAWNQCQYVDWMLRRIRQKLKDNTSLLLHKKLILCNCKIARLVMEYMPQGDGTLLVAIERAEAWACGLASIEDMQRAASAAYAAAYTSDKAARDTIPNQCADIVRQYFTTKDLR